MLGLNKVELTNGKVLVKLYGKYEPNLCLIVDKDYIIKEEYERLPINYKETFPYDLNLGPIHFYWTKGRYFVSKKGTKCFEVNSNGPHYLLQDDWGGNYGGKGHNLDKLKNLYYIRKTSNAGGSGVDFAVIEDGEKFTLNEEDI